MTSEDAYRAVVTGRIAELLRWRAWYRTNRWAAWDDLRHQHEAELRALLRLARKARHAPDPIDEYKGWTEAEKASSR